MSALRTLRQLAVTSTRALAVRPAASVARRGFPGQLARMAVPVARTFSASARKLGEGTTDLSLSQKLQEELKYEQEAAVGADQVPEFLKAFNEQGIWDIEDVHGNDEVTLTRKFGNENIRLIFSIADIQAEDEDFQNEENEDQGEESGSQDEPLNSYPIRASVSITKSAGPGVLNVDMVCQEGHFLIDNISFYRDNKLGTELTAEADWKRRGLYIGPQFDSLDVGVQEEFERYLQERGINESLALFIPEYAEYKEQLEYVNWIGNVKTFIDL